MVVVRDGLPVHCTCPADQEYAPACKHRLAIAIREPVLAAVRKQASDRPVADGGVEATSTPDREDSRTEPPEWCDCADSSVDFPCWECYARGRKPLPQG
ncbi:SWIM zinc finger family protein [Halorarius litoreus]|uniref:SWIM zinc finger family protein n=1 Tax=Halorarius litoreus TaxID=2962676 RepID=UPI0020CF3F7B|nr:SWIM zinc finger family protein [Halorarius litoreus]